MWIAAWSRDPMRMENCRKNLKGEEKERGTEARCGEKSEAPIAAFRRSSLLMRSPPAKRALGSGGVVIGTGHSASKDAGALPDTPTMGLDPRGGACEESAFGGSTEMGDARCGSTQLEAAVREEEVTVSEIKESSPRLEMIQKMRRMEEEVISQCKVTLSGMQRAINRQRNISNEVKTGISKMAELLDVMMNYRRTWKTAEGERAFSNLRRNVATLRLAEAPTPKTTNPKRAATSPAVPAGSKKARARTPSPGGGKTTEKREEGWETVTSKKKRKRKAKRKLAGSSKGDKPRSKPSKPEAIVVRPAEGRSYAEVLKNLRAKMVTDDSAKIRSIRKTMTGAILLELGKGEKIEPNFVKQLRNTVREAAHISELKPTVTVEIRDLDSLTDKEEVETAVRKLLANQEEQMRTRITTPNVREQVRAFITLSAESAARLIKVGDIRIGFIRSKVRVCEEIRRCYRCLGTGHLQSNCSGPDRRNVCIRCGEGGHKMKECKAAPKCALCTDAKCAQMDHMTGSRRCPQIRK